MDSKTKRDNLAAYEEGLKELSVNTAEMLHAAFVAYLDEMRVTYTAVEAAEWLGKVCWLFLRQAGEHHEKLHPVELQEDLGGRLCFCGIVEFGIKDACPIARFVHSDGIKNSAADTAVQ